MKTELQIAKENVESMNSNVFTHREVLTEHKESCQRFLEWVEKNEYWMTYKEAVQSKIKDLKEAIEIYNQNGI